MQLRPQQCLTDPALPVLLWRFARAQLVMTNVTIIFRNPSRIDTCSQYTRRAVFALQQLNPIASTAMVNETGGRMMGPVRITVDVRNGSSNAPGEMHMRSHTTLWAKASLSHHLKHLRLGVNAGCATRQGVCCWLHIWVARQRCKATPCMMPA
jgi:hypothetical protein